MVLTRGGRTPTHDPAAIIERERAAERPAQGAEIGNHTVIPEGCMAVRSGARDLAGLIYRLRREAESRRHAVRPAVAGTHHLPGFVDEVVVVDAIPHFAEHRLLAVRPQEYRQLAPGQAYGHDLSGIVDRECLTVGSPQATEIDGDVAARDAR